MRRTAFLILLLALALAPGAQAELVVGSQPERTLVGAGHSLSLEHGRGLAVVRSRDGSILGSVGRGRVRITNVARGERTKVAVSCCERTRRPNRRTIACSGRRLSFSVTGGAWKVVLSGNRVNASAVLLGAVTLRGTRGTFSIANGPERAWPRTARTFRLR